MGCGASSAKTQPHDARHKSTAKTTSLHLYHSGFTTAPTALDSALMSQRSQHYFNVGEASNEDELALRNGLVVIDKALQKARECMKVFPLSDEEPHISHALGCDENTVFSDAQKYKDALETLNQHLLPRAAGVSFSVMDIKFKFAGVNGAAIYYRKYTDLLKQAREDIKPHFRTFLSSWYCNPLMTSHGNRWHLRFLMREFMGDQFSHEYLDLEQKKVEKLIADNSKAALNKELENCNLFIRTRNTMWGEVFDALEEKCKSLLPLFEEWSNKVNPSDAEDVSANAWSEKKGEYVSIVSSNLERHDYIPFSKKKTDTGVFWEETTAAEGEKSIWNLTWGSHLSHDWKRLEKALRLCSIHLAERFDVDVDKYKIKHTPSMSPAENIGVVEEDTVSHKKRTYSEFNMEQLKRRSGVLWNMGSGSTRDSEVGLYGYRIGDLIYGVETTDIEIPQVKVEAVVRRGEAAPKDKPTTTKVHRGSLSKLAWKCIHPVREDFWFIVFPGHNCLEGIDLEEILQVKGLDE